MGLKGWIQDPLGLKALVCELKVSEIKREALLGTVLRIAQEQTAAAAALVGVIERMTENLITDGTPPEGRHMTEEMEAALYEEMEKQRELNG